jgi:hypothetical protein
MIEASYSFSNKCADNIGERAGDDEANSYRRLKILETRTGRGAEQNLQLLVPR